MVVERHPTNRARFCLHVAALSEAGLQHPPDFTEMPGDYLIYQNGCAVKVGYKSPFRETHRL